MRRRALDSDLETLVDALELRVEALEDCVERRLLHVEDERKHRERFKPVPVDRIMEAMREMTLQMPLQE